MRGDGAPPILTDLWSAHTCALYLLDVLSLSLKRLKVLGRLWNAGLTLHSRYQPAWPKPDGKLCFPRSRDLIAFVWPAFAQWASADSPRMVGLPSRSAVARRLVEPDGIEPTTSCLQSTRSTN